MSGKDVTCSDLCSEVRVSSETRSRCSRSSIRSCISFLRGLSLGPLQGRVHERLCHSAGACSAGESSLLHGARHQRVEIPDTASGALTARSSFARVAATPASFQMNLALPKASRGSILKLHKYTGGPTLVASNFHFLRFYPPQVLKPGPSGFVRTLEVPPTWEYQISKSESLTLLNLAPPC